MNQLLADDYARNGFKVIVPDIFTSPLPADALSPEANFDVATWFGSNGPNVTEPRARKVLDALKSSGITKIGVLGYCYGARIGFDFAFEGLIDVVVVAHPSLLSVPEDIEVSGFFCPRLP